MPTDDPTPDPRVDIYQDAIRRVIDSLQVSLPLLDRLLVTIGQQQVDATRARASLRRGAEALHALKPNRRGSGGVR